MDQKKEEKLFRDFPPISTAEWEARITADLKGADYQKKLIWKTGEGFDVKPYYREEDLEGLEYLKSLPGEEPFLRGNRTDHNRWDIRQDIQEAGIKEANRLALDAIARGADSVGLNVKEISTHRQMSDLLAGIELKKTGVHLISSRSYPLSLELFIYEINHRGEGGEQVRGSLNFDPVSYLLLSGDFYVNWAHNLEETEYLISAIQKRLPRFKAITVNGHYFQNAGSTLVQELAFSLASAVEYLSGLTSKGMAVDQVAPHIQFSLATGSGYFLEIAKLRAVRLLWTRMVEQFNPEKEESKKLFVHTTTALWNKSVFDPYVNMLRTTTEAMSAAIGNADSLTIQPFNVAFSTADDFSRRIARNQQLILKEEAYLDQVADPSAGSYYIENLTHSIAVHAWKLFQEIEKRGGFIGCFKAGYIQDIIGENRMRREAEYAQRKSIFIGTTQYPNLKEKMLDKVGTLSGSPVQEGTFKRLVPFRATAAFEKIRLATESFIKAGHKQPSVFLFTMGNLAMLRARAGFITNFFGCAGFEIIDNPGFSTVDEGVESALASGAELVVICSSDEEYATIAPEIAGKIKGSKPGIRVLVAGYPAGITETLQAAGIDDFIHIRSNLMETLVKYQSLLGIS